MYQPLMRPFSFQDQTFQILRLCQNLEFFGKTKSLSLDSSSPSNFRQCRFFYLDSLNLAPQAVPSQSSIGGTRNNILSLPSHELLFWLPLSSTCVPWLACLIQCKCPENSFLQP
ncbi:hypothetical protein E1A91_A10G167000v1 [Gossypium mustelinum]|uniref:Uncharacterized protein n=1 Tax=Gossypium mustelinum TaxID=34275 RepID=A0A5D2XME3_GOSMU|nr:hypothetical protein E1A91_A10G167000v1 [Gossypium mustelinum]TYJ15174.1 hypothetical protein E1A91_A10G167000v1 [Gossypium mustelinum]TYJ15175.1 hypothetical protein E1A91_A10G167000v1 [Gossypium mustelinum]